MSNTITQSLKRKVRWKSAIHAFNGCVLIFLGTWIANGNLISPGGIVAVLGCLCILLELLDIGYVLATHNPADVIKRRQFRTLLKCDCKEPPIRFINRVPAGTHFVPSSQVIYNFNPEFDEAFDYFARNNLLMMDQDGDFLIIDDGP